MESGQWLVTRDAWKFLKQLRLTWLLCSPAMDKAKHAAAIFSLPWKHNDNYRCPLWAPVMQRMNQVGHDSNACKPNLEINATYISWIKNYAITEMYHTLLTGITLVSNAIPVVPSWSPTEGRLILWSHWPRLKSCETGVIFHWLSILKSESLTPSIKLLCQGDRSNPPSIMFSFTVFYCDTNWQSQVSIECWRRESLWPRHISHLTVPDPSRTSTKYWVWFMRFAWLYSQCIQVKKYLANIYISLSYSALNDRSWHWRQFANPWRPWHIGPKFSSQAFHRTSSIISKAGNIANSGNIYRWWVA